MLADQHLRVPAAERPDAQEPVVVGVLALDVGDDQPDLVQVPEQQDGRPGLGPDAGERVAEDVAGDAREGARVPAPHGRRRLLVTGGCRGPQQLVEERARGGQHGRDATISPAW